MGECWSTVVLQGAQHRIAIDLVAGAVQKTAAIIATDIVAVRGDTTPAGDVFRRACVQDSVSDLQCTGHRNADAVVSANGAIRDVATAIDSATRNRSIVAANRAVTECSVPEIPPPRPYGWPSCSLLVMLPLIVLLVIVSGPPEMPPPLR